MGITGQGSDNKGNSIGAARQSVIAEQQGISTEQSPDDTKPGNLLNSNPFSVGHAHIDVNGLLSYLQKLLPTEPVTLESIPGYFSTAQLAATTEVEDSSNTFSATCFCTTLGELTHYSVTPHNLKVEVVRRNVFLGSLDGTEKSYAVTYEVNLLSHYLQAIVVGKGSYNVPDPSCPTRLTLQIESFSLLPLAISNQLQDWLDIFKYQNPSMDDATGALDVKLEEPIRTTADIIFNSSKVLVVRSRSEISVLKRVAHRALPEMEL